MSVVSNAVRSAASSITAVKVIHKVSPFFIPDRAESGDTFVQEVGGGFALFPPCCGA